jgi:hypothetical protein
MGKNAVQTSIPAGHSGRTAQSNRLIGLGVEDEFSGSVAGVDGQLPLPWTGPAILSGACKMWSTVRL